MRIIIIDMTSGAVKGILRPEFSVAPFLAGENEGIVVDCENSAPIAGVEDQALLEGWVYNAASQLFAPKNG